MPLKSIPFFWSLSKMIMVLKNTSIISMLIFLKILTGNTSLVTIV